MLKLIGKIFFWIFAIAGFSLMAAMVIMKPGLIILFFVLGYFISSKKQEEEKNLNESIA